MFQLTKLLGRWKLGNMNRGLFNKQSKYLFHVGDLVNDYLVGVDRETKVFGVRTFVLHSCHLRLLKSM